MKQPCIERATLPARLVGAFRQAQPSQSRMVTIRDVAKKSGFSATTVSLVLNDAPLARNIPVTTKDRIKSVAQELGYRPNIFARSLRNKRSQTIGVVVYDVTDSYCAQVLRGIDSGLYKSGYLSLLTDVQNDNARFKRSLEMLLLRRVEALIVLANPQSLKIDLLRMFDTEDVPTILIGRTMRHESFSSVMVNNEAGARLALKHLYELNHRRIAFIKGPQRIEDSHQRWMGITKFAEEVGLKIDFDLVVELKEISPSYELGHQLTLELLARQKRFTALLAFDDMTAFGAIRAMKTRGLDVPNDCSVIGFDDTPAAAYYCPSLSTICQQMELLGKTGVDIALRSIAARLQNKPISPVCRSIEATLLARESTRPI